MTAISLASGLTATIAAIAPIVASLGRRPAQDAPSPEEAAEAARERRAFVNEMLCSNPDAFRSEMDVEMMMSHFPHRF